MVLPQNLLFYAERSPVCVYMKNGDTFIGELGQCDRQWNMKLHYALEIDNEGQYTFINAPVCLRGMSISSVQILDVVVDQIAAQLNHRSQERPRSERASHTCAPWRCPQ